MIEKLLSWADATPEWFFVCWMVIGLCLYALAMETVAALVRRYLHHRDIMRAARRPRW